jgi:3'-phosphoadenosine 5'-phosphosulfate sulfotransferase (PAPS reductase)/FAD synthetase
MPKGVYKRQSNENLKIRLAEIKKMQAVPLNQKINITKQVLLRASQLQPLALFFSGGKDSTVLLDILKKTGLQFCVIHNNTTMADKKTLEYIREVCKNIDYVETTPEETPIEMWHRTGYYPILGKRTFTKYKKKHAELKVSPVQCCYQLKEVYSNRICKKRGIKGVIWGNRASESNRRKLTFADNGFIFKPKKYDWFQIYPIQHWLEKDILSYLETNLPEYPISKQFESGCRYCATDLAYYPNSMSRLYNADKKEWLNLMFAGFGEQIAILNNIKDWKTAIKTQPELFLRLKKGEK